MRMWGRLILIAVIIGLTRVPFAGAGELRVSGAATVAKAVIEPNKAAIEKETGLTLVMAVNGDGNGLKDLQAGRCDVAMVAAPMKLTEETVNKVAAGTLNVSEFQMAPIGGVNIRFVVNPANPVKSLTAQQVHDIFTGKITSWKDVGGDDTPIIVIAEAQGLGTRGTVIANFLHGEEITASARIMQGLVQLVQVTSQVPGAISYGNPASINASVAVIPGIEVKQEIGLATKGAPSADAKKLIEVVTKYAQEAH
jgi:phosphate transport system substrate-binding protein